MRKFRNTLKGGLCLGLALSLMLSGTSCGKEKAVVEEYAGETASATETVADSADSDSIETATESATVEGYSLKEMFGETISETEAFNLEGISGTFELSYNVPDVAPVSVYEGSFIENSSEIEDQIVSSFFGGTEEKLEEIKYENDTDYIPLLYKYRTILMYQDTGSLVSDVTDAAFAKYTSIIDSSFEETYTWVDETDYYIHMYQGEYNGNRYGMIYSYDNVNSTRNIYICPISIAEYFPEIDATSVFVVDPESGYDSENLCAMSEDDVMSEAGNVLVNLGFDEKDVVLTVNPNTAIIQDGTFDYSEVGFTYTEMPKLVFTDADVMDFAQKNNAMNPAGRIYSYKNLKGIEPEDMAETVDTVTFTENGYAVYLCSAPFSENVIPQADSTFNRGSIFYTDKGLFSVEISQVAGLDNVADDTQLLSFSEIKESYKEALQNDSEITSNSSGSVDVVDVDFTYVLIENEEDKSKASYVPAWVFTTQDSKFKSGTDPLTYPSIIISAIDGSDLRSVIK